jgi:hypothetical protein
MKEQSTNIPELIVNQSNEIEDDIEIIPSNILQDDFFQLDLNEYNKQPNIVSFIYEIFFSKYFLLDYWAIISNKNGSTKNISHDIYLVVCLFFNLQ